MSPKIISLALLLFLALLPILTFPTPALALTITLNFPPNYAQTLDTTPTFNFTPTGSSSSYNCTLYIDGTNYGEATNIPNNTAAEITPSSALSAGDHNWNITCEGVGTTETGTSETRVIGIGENFSRCAVLIDPGTYKLTGDIINSSTSYCINIQANDVVLDCQNHLIDGDDNADYGIYIYRSSAQTTNITIKNCKVSDWDGANIYLYQANGNTLTNINTSSSPDSGIFLTYSNSNTLSNITSYSNYEGICLYKSNSNTLSNITTYSNTYGIYTYGNSNTLSNIAAYSNYRGIWLEGSNTLKNSKIYKSYSTGIGLNSADSNLIYNNYFNNTNNFEFFGGIYPNQWNITKQEGDNIYDPNNPYIGGNFWAKPSGDGYSQTCNDTDNNGFCDDPFILAENNTDYLPLTWIFKVQVDPKNPPTEPLYLQENKSYQLFNFSIGYPTIGKITEINITLPEGITFVPGSQFTSAQNTIFVKSGNSLIWKNTTADGFIGKDESFNFGFKANLSSVGSYTINITFKNNMGRVNSVSYTYFVKNISLDVELDKEVVQKNANVTVSGRALLLPDNEPVRNTTVYVWIDSNLLGTTKTDSNGNFTFSFTAPSVSDIYTISVNLTNDKGIVGRNSTKLLVYKCKIRVIDSASSPVQNISVYIYKSGELIPIYNGSTDNNGYFLAVFNYNGTADISVGGEVLNGYGKTVFNDSLENDFTIIWNPSDIAAYSIYGEKLSRSLAELVGSDGRLYCLGYTDSNGKIICNLNSSISTYYFHIKANHLYENWSSIIYYNKSIDYASSLSVYFQKEDMEKINFLKYRHLFYISQEPGWNLSLQLPLYNLSYFDGNYTDISVFFNNSERMIFKINNYQGSSAEIIFPYKGKGFYYFYYGSENNDSVRYFELDVPDDWRNSVYKDWEKRKPIYIDEGYSLTHTNEPVEINISGNFLGNCADLRIATSSDTEIPYKLISTDNSSYCYVVFPMNVSDGTSLVIYAYYSNPIAQSPNYSYIPNYSLIPSNQTTADKGDENLTSLNSYDLLLSGNGGNVINCIAGDTGHECENLIDGDGRTANEDYRTSFSNAGSWNNIFEFNFSENKVSHLVIRLGTNGASKVKIYFSLDGDNWTQIMRGTWKNGKGEYEYVENGIFNLTYNSSSYDDSNKNEIFFYPVNAKYLKLEFYVPSTVFSIDEIELYSSKSLDVSVGKEEKIIKSANSTSYGRESMRIIVKDYSDELLNATFNLYEHGYWIYKRDIIVNSGVGEYLVDVKINSSKLISEGKVLPNGKDLMLLDEDNGVEIPIYIANWNSSETHILFKVNLSGSSKVYSLYYGNFNVSRDRARLTVDDIPSLIKNHNFENGENNWTRAGQYNLSLTGVGNYGYIDNGYRIVVDPSMVYGYVYQLVPISENASYLYGIFINQSEKQDYAICLGSAVGACDYNANTSTVNKWIFISEVVDLSSDIYYNMRVDNGTAYYDYAILYKTVGYALGSEELGVFRKKMSSKTPTQLGVQFIVDDFSLYTINFSTQNFEGYLFDIEPFQRIEVQPFSSKPIFSNLSTANLPMVFKINVSAIRGDRFVRNISKVYVDILSGDTVKDRVNLSGNSLGGVWEGNYIPDTLGTYKIVYNFEDIAKDKFKLRAGSIDIRKLVFSDINYSYNRGYKEQVFYPSDVFNLSVCIKEFNGTSYFNVTSGNFTVKISRGDTIYQQESMQFVGGCTWKVTNLTAPSTYNNYYNVTISGTSYPNEIYGENFTHFYVDRAPYILSGSNSVIPASGYYWENFTFSANIIDDYQNVNVSLYVSTDNKTSWKYKGSKIVYGIPSGANKASINASFEYTDVGTDNYYRFLLDDGYVRVYSDIFYGPSEIRNKIVVLFNQEYYAVYRNDSYSPNSTKIDFIAQDYAGNNLSNVNISLYVNETYKGSCITDANGTCYIVYNPIDSKDVGNYTLMFNGAGENYDSGYNTSYLIIKGKMFISIQSPSDNQTLYRGKEYLFNSTTENDLGKVMHPNVTWRFLNDSHHVMEVFGIGKENLTHRINQSYEGLYYLNVSASFDYYDDAFSEIKLNIEKRLLVPNITNPQNNTVLLRGATYWLNSTTKDIEGYIVHPNTTWYLLDDVKNVIDTFGQDKENVLYTISPGLSYNYYYIRLNVSKQYYDSNYAEIRFLLKYRSAVNITQYVDYVYRGDNALFSSIVTDYDTNENLSYYNVDWYVDEEYKSTVQTGSNGEPSSYIWETSGYSLGYHNISAVIGEKVPYYVPWINKSEVKVMLKGILNVAILSPSNQSSFEIGDVINLNAQVGDDINATNPTDNYTINWILNDAVISANKTQNWTIPNSWSLGYQELRVNVSGDYYDSDEENIYVYIYGHSKVEYVEPKNNESTGVFPYTPNPLKIVCRVMDYDKAEPVQGYNVSFYVNGSYVGYNLTNASGYAYVYWTIPSVSGLFNISCKINSEDYYIATYNSSYYLLNVSEVGTQGNLSIEKEEYVLRNVSFENGEEVGIKVTFKNVGDGIAYNVTINLTNATYYTADKYSYDCGKVPQGDNCSAVFNLTFINNIVGVYKVNFSATWVNHPDYTTNITYASTNVNITDNPILEIDSYVKTFEPPIKVGTGAYRLKNITLYSKGNVDLKNVTVLCYAGEICEDLLLEISDNNFNLSKGSNKTISVNLTVPQTYDSKGYVLGKLKIYSQNQNFYQNRTTKYVDLKVKLFEENTSLNQTPRYIEVSNISDYVVKKVNLTLYNYGNENLTEVNITLRFNVSLYDCVNTLECNDMVIEPSYVLCDIIGENENCSATFNVTIFKSTNPYDWYWLEGKAVYRNEDFSISEKTNKTRLKVGGSVSFTVTPTQFIDNIEHGTQNHHLGEINITNDGNTVVVSVDVYVNGGLNSTWFNIQPYSYSSISVGQSVYSDVYVSIPSGQDPGYYEGYINVSSGNAGTKQIYVNITIPENRSWVISPTYEEKIVGVDSYGILEVNISNLGNVNQTFSISCASSDPTVISILSCPSSITVGKVSSAIAEVQYVASGMGNAKVEITILNTETNEARISVYNLTVIDTKPEIDEPPAYVRYRDINYETQVIVVNITDNKPMNDGWAWVIISKPDGTEINISMNISEVLSGTSPYKYKYTAQFVPDLDGTYSFVIYAKDSSDQISRTEHSYTFTGVPSTILNLDADAYREVSGVTSNSGKCYVHTYNITNVGYGSTGYGGAYNTTFIVKNLPTGWVATPSSKLYGKINGSQKVGDSAEICIPPGTYYGNYSFIFEVQWKNPNDVLSRVQKFITVNVLPTPILEVSPIDPINNIDHGATFTINYTLKNSGNIDAKDVNIYRTDNLANITTDIFPNYVSLLKAGESIKINVTIHIPFGYLPGTYTLYINNSASNTNVLQSIQLTIIENKTWTRSPSSIEKYVATNSTGTFGYIYINNTGNVLLNFDLNITGDISSYLSYPSYVSVSKQDTNQVEIVYNSPAIKGNYTGILNISSSANPSSRKVNLTLYVRPLELTILSHTNKTNASEIIYVKSKLLYNDNPVNNASFIIHIGNKTCNVINETYLGNGLWNISCISPTLPDGIYYNLTVTALAFIGNNEIEGTSKKDNAIFYVDVSPPIIKEVFAESKEVTDESQLTNSTVIANISDPSGVSAVKIRVYKNGQLVSESNMSKITETSWKTILTNLTYGDYDINISATDTLGHTSYYSGWIEVFQRGVYIKGISKNAEGKNILVRYSFFRNGKGFLTKYQIPDCTFEVNGSFYKEIHKRIYDLLFEANNHKLYIYNVSITNNITDPIKIDEAASPVDYTSYPWERGLIHFKKVVGIESNISFSKSELHLYTSGYDPNMLRLFKCENWDWGGRKCNSDWSEVNVKSRTGNYIIADINSFSAYAIVTVTCDTSAGYVLCGGVCYKQEECPYCCGGVCSSSPCATATSTTVSGSSEGGGGGGGGYRESTTTQISAKCGNGICEFGENSENCPEDCKSRSLSFTVDTDAINIQLRPGESKIYTIRIAYFGEEEEKAYLSISGEIWHYVSLENAEIAVKPDEISTVNLKVEVPIDTEPGTYIGRLDVMIGDKVQSLPVTLLIVPQEEALLDVKVETISKKICRKDPLKIYVAIYNLGHKKRFDIILNYKIKNITGNVIGKYKETVAVETSLSFIKVLNIQNLSLSYGRYFIELEALYENKTALSVDTFEIVKLPWWYSWLPKIAVSGCVLLILFFSYRYYKIKKLEKLRYLFPVDYKTLPREGLYIGKIAETKVKAYLPTRDLTTHMIIAGATGSGKTVAAMGIAEECLERKIPVIVFDPTGQWTGFVKPCRDKNVMSYYKYFEMTEYDVKSYPGMIYEIIDPNEKIDIKKYMNPGEITIFVLNKLKPGEYDIAIRNVIDSIFAQRFEESTDLRVLLVFDEVHRLLERYGGKGGYVALEKAAREFRKWGIGIIMISQVLSDFKEALKGNVLTEVQMNTKSIEDINRARQKYGDMYAKRITMEEVGVGMIQNPKYNRGKPYWIWFKPPRHDPHKIPESDFEMYKKYARILEELENKIQKLKKAGKDTFDLELELKLAKDKLKTGKFRMAEIYVESLRSKL